MKYRKPFNSHLSFPSAAGTEGGQSQQTERRRSRFRHAEVEHVHRYVGGAGFLLYSGAGNPVSFHIVAVAVLKHEFRIQQLVEVLVILLVEEAAAASIDHEGDVLGAGLVAHGYHILV